MQIEEMKKNFQLVVEKLESSQGVIETKAYEILNETDILANMIKEVIEELNGITDSCSIEEKNKALLRIKEFLPILLEYVYVANEVSHDLEEKAEDQKETIDNMQYIVDFLFDID